MYGIKRIIPLLNGIDLESMKEMDYAQPQPTQPGKSKDFGPKVMAKTRYLLLLYIGKRVPLFRADDKGVKEINGLIYFTANSIDKIAKHPIFKPYTIDYDHRHAKEKYLKYEREGKGLVIHEKRDDGTHLYALTVEGELYCNKIVDALTLQVPEMRRKDNKNVPNRSEIVSLSSDFDEIKNELYNSYGLTWLPNDYFESHQSSSNDLDNWRKGFSFELPSIRSGQELRRKGIIHDIKTKLENEKRILIIGPSGSSKSTILMELICDYFEAGFEVLYNFGVTEIINPDRLINFVENILNDGKKVMLALDNTHQEKMCQVFYIIDKLSNSSFAASNLRSVMTARIPEFDRLTKVGLSKVEEEVRKSIRKLTSDATFIYHLPSFTIEEISDFIKLYLPITDGAVINKKSREIYSYTGGDPILVRFFTMGQGLRQDVEEKYDRYLRSQLEMKTMLVCSLLDISSVKITSSILEKCGVLKGAYALADATLSQDHEDSWRTKHLRWNEEFLSMLYNEKNGAILLDRKLSLDDAIESIFNIRDKKIACAVIESIYKLSATGLIPISIVDNVTKIPKYLNKETKRDLLTFTIGPAYSDVKEYDKAVATFDGILRIDPDYFAALYHKGLALSLAGRHNEAITCYDKALNIDPNFAEAWNNKGLDLYLLGKNKIHEFYYVSCFDRALDIDPLCSPAWLNKGNIQVDLGKYQDAIDYYDKALNIDPTYVDVWNNKGLALHQLRRYNEAVECYDKALNIDRNFVNALYGKGLALEELGKHDDALECYNKALQLPLTNHQRADLWYMKGKAFDQVGRYDDAIGCYDEAQKIDKRGADVLYDEGSSRVRKTRSHRPKIL